MSESRTYTAPKPRRRVIRPAKIGTAATAIGELTPGCEIFVLTYGQFSLIDALTAILKQTGPAHITLATWSAADADLRRAKALLASAAILSMRFIVDRSFATRHPSYCASMREFFGDECIRTTRSHAKFATITNDRWNLAIRTSMNLNHNPRLENLEISDDADLCGFFTLIADEIFAEQPKGVTNGELPLLDAIENVPQPSPIAAGKLETSNLRPAATGLPRI